MKAILVNIFGGIMKCDTIATGVIAACRGPAAHGGLCVGEHPRGASAGQCGPFWGVYVRGRGGRGTRRHRRRATFSFVIPAGATSPWVYCRNDGSIFLVFLNGDKAVNLWRARHVPRSDADWEIKVLALAGAVWAAPRITGDPSHRLRIIATRADGSGVYTSTSDDDGATWTGAA